MTTPYHAKYFAHELAHPSGAGVERLSQSLFDACVDMYRRQVEAALFVLRSPLSSGALLADEAGLGKTIEAGLVMCEYCAGRRQRQRIFEVEDAVMEKRDGLIAALERRMAQKTHVEPLFTIHWAVLSARELMRIETIVRGHQDDFVAACRRHFVV